MVAPPQIEIRQEFDSTVFEGRVFVFTGELYELTRSEAIRLVEKRGGTCKNAVSTFVSHLVVGQELWNRYKQGDAPTTKICKAMELQAVEHPIQIIPEVAFLTSLVRYEIE